MKLPAFIEQMLGYDLAKLNLRMYVIKRACQSFIENICNTSKKISKFIDSQLYRYPSQSLSNCENRASIAISVVELLKKQPIPLYFEMDNSNKS